MPRRIAILGSSGSIGRSALEVIAESNGRLEAALLSVHRRTDILVEQIRQMTARQTTLPRWVVIPDPNADRTPLAELPPGIEVFFGHEALCELVQKPEINIVLSAIVGSAGLTSTWAALEAGKCVALANKETLVMGGSRILELIQPPNTGMLIPVDSEHSAIMQALQSWRMTPIDRAPADNVISKLILTASGGPFRTWTTAQLAGVTVKDALDHPTWSMGKKITIDSATMMNKALEIIEARWFFDVPAEKINVVIHPQSIVHSMVEFIDGSTLAQLGMPDMRLPIQLALNYPDRFAGPATRMDWTKPITLEFLPPDMERFPAIALGLEVAAAAGTAGAVVNAANETAVAAFLGNRLQFQNIVKVCRSVLEHHQYEQRPTLDRLLELDGWARKETEKWISQ